ncbi:MAG: C_GCAxxG_C_C family protein [Clostridia bacterium]|nr:C_GCAxxG_C_C family protein [Clostridia bacterium]
MSETNRVEKAEELFSSGLNCAQAVFCAYSDLFGLDEDTSLKISSGFGGGFGRMREVCGAFSAVTMIAGLARKSAQADDKAEIYRQIRLLADEFRKRNGSIICGELLGERTPASHVPAERTQEYFKKRPCPEIVGEAAEIIEEFIIGKANEI